MGRKGKKAGNPKDVKKPGTDLPGTGLVGGNTSVVEAPPPEEAAAPAIDNEVGRSGSSGSNAHAGGGVQQQQHTVPAPGLQRLELDPKPTPKNPAPVCPSRRLGAAGPVVPPKDKFRGILCGVEMERLQDCADNVFSNEGFHKLIAADKFKCADDEVKKKELGDQMVSVCYSIKKGTNYPNKLASRILFAYGNEFLLRGDAIFVCLYSDPTKPDKNGHVQVMKPVLFERIEKKLSEMDERKFDGWFSGVAQQFGCHDANEPGHLIYIPASTDEPVRTEDVTCRGFEDIAMCVEQKFIDGGAKQESAADESDQDAQNDKLKQTFAQHGLVLCWIHNIKNLNWATVSENCRTTQQRVVNRRFVRYIYLKFGLDQVQQSMQTMRGDIILFRPSRFWAREEIAMTKFDPEDLTMLNESPGSAEEEEEIGGAIENFETAYVLNRFVSFNQYHAELKKLANLAQPEDWNNRAPQPHAPQPQKTTQRVGKNEDLPYLDNFLRFTFALSVKHHKGMYSIPPTRGSKTTLIVFATNLLTKYQQPIYGHFERSAEDDDADMWREPTAVRKWTFNQWSTHSKTNEPILPIDVLSDECLTHGASSVNLVLHELKTFNPFKHIDVANLEHILKHTQRFQQDNQIQGLIGKGGWSVEPGELARQLKGCLERAVSWCRMDRSCAVVTCFHSNSYQWLLPLLNPAESPRRHPTLVLVLKPLRKNPDEDFCYVVKTVLTLDMALKMARLCGLLSQRWTVSRTLMEDLQNLQKMIERIPIANEDVRSAVVVVKNAFKQYRIGMQKALPAFGAIEETIDLDPTPAPSNQPWRGRTPSERSVGGASTVVSEPGEPDDKWERVRAR
mmetsp:Transcript_73150/g.210028  ORF Transcript_73150/g.210028 Transcript_73150/m.210028 type:complete len:845 (-) Transcript_73150:309-2843(-)